MLVSTNTFLRRVAERTGLAPEACGALVERTVVAIASQLHAQTMSALTDNLPPTLAGWAEGAPRGGVQTLRDLLGGGLPLGDIAVVCGAVAELMPLAVLAALRVGLQSDLAALLVPREPAPADLSAWRLPP